MTRDAAVRITYVVHTDIGMTMMVNLVKAQSSASRFRS